MSAHLAVTPATPVEDLSDAPSGARTVAALACLVASLWISSCAPSTESGSPAETASPIHEQLAGRWRGVLQSPGGALPFGLEIESDPFSAVVVNGAERAPFSGVEVEGNEVVFAFDWYDARVSATYDAASDTLHGEWRKTIPDGESHLPFSATRGERSRFEPIAADGVGTIADISGVWDVLFTDEDGSEPARGEFTQTGSDVVGTFLTPTGDYRFLAGSFEAGTLRLSTFDGAHAFLFSAALAEDGRLEGDFWSRDVYHATWVAERAEGEDAVPSDWQEVGLANDEGRFRFEFPDLDGETVSLDDARFDDKVVVVNIFGSWCPNCNDEAPLLAEWDRRWRDDGLEIVGLAYEFSGDPDRDATVVRRYAERHGIGFTLLLAGTSDKKDAAETLPDLPEVIAYPTTVFIDRDRTVRRIHSGFAGPGTGAHHEELRSSLESTLTELLQEG